MKRKSAIDCLNLYKYTLHHWEAKYEFGSNKRKVHNKIRARFYFDQGQIIEHTDVFDFWKWSSMALGLPGLLMGWSPIIRKKVRKTIKKRLLDYKSNSLSRP